MPDSNQISREPFEGLGENYRFANNEGMAPMVLAEYKAIAETIAGDGQENVLDWGCSFGHVANFLNELGLEVESFDFVPDFGEPERHGLTAYPGLTATLSGDPVALPYSDQQFGAVLSLGTLEHVEFPERSLLEIARVLRPGGRFYCYKLPNRLSYVEKLGKWAGHSYHGGWPNDRIYTIRLAREMFEAAGFGIIDIRYRNMFPLRAAGKVFGGSRTTQVRRVSDALARVPLVQLVATNIEVIAVKLD